MSDLVVAPFNSITSGATTGRIYAKYLCITCALCMYLLQFGVPEMVSASTVFSFRLSETPKSVSLTSPVLVVNILADFRSQ